MIHVLTGHREHAIDCPESDITPKHENSALFLLRGIGQSAKKVLDQRRETSLQIG
jgi:hypothetical protein